jgi:23S rRNA (pseudouridine1915-N3)-methyltransferase
MMHIDLFTVGQLKENYLEQGISEYFKRLQGLVKIQMIEVAEERAPDKCTTAIVQQIKKKEGEKLLAKLSRDHYVIALAIEGATMSSEQLASKLKDLADYSQNKVAFLIGGSWGLSSEVMARADLAISFGQFTLPHQLMRLVLIEQIYRVCKINRGETYHK